MVIEMVKCPFNKEIECPVRRPSVAVTITPTEMPIPPEAQAFMQAQMQAQVMQQQIVQSQNDAVMCIACRLNAIADAVEGMGVEISYDEETPDTDDEVTESKEEKKSTIKAGREKSPVRSKQTYIE
jgi:hypothetical protein